MSHSPSEYRATNMDRVNPQFVGIAEKYSQHKKYRIESDKKRKNAESNYQYLQKLNEEMDKNLSQKSKELRKLQRIRERHNNDMKQKMQEAERKRRRLENLRNRSAQQKKNLRNGLKNAYEMVKSQRGTNKMKIKEKQHELEIEFREKKKEEFTQNCMRHQSIELGKKIGNERINQYYRHKNQMSLNNYMTMISEEDGKRERNRQMIKKMNDTIYKYKRDVNNKQEKLKKVMDEISLYSVDSAQQRKANMLATADLFRPLNTSSSQRSKPAEILKLSLRSSKAQEDFL